MMKMLAERRCGELLRDMDKNPGVRMSGSNIVLPPETPTLANLDIAPMQSSRWQKVAAVPEVEFERYIADKKEIERMRHSWVGDN